MKRLKYYLTGLKNNNPWLLLLWLEKLKKKGIKDLKENNDLDAINKLYYDYAGKYPDLENPKTFSDKMQWMKLYYHDPLMSRCADKYEVRSFIEAKGYAYTLNGLIAVYKSVEEIDVKSLPVKFVMKASHGSGWNLICKDKNKINWIPWKKIMNIWLNSNVFWPGREWPYKNMTPRIICEKYIEDESGQLMDYKFFCFNGVPKFIQANKGRGTKRHAQNFYDTNWKILPFGKNLEPLPGVIISQPVTFREMLEIARDLSGRFPFVRVDFYEVQGRVIFGELTFFPKSGLPDFTPPEYDLILGEMLTLPDSLKEA